MDNFSLGIASFGIPQIGSGDLIPVQTGNYRWVSSVSGNNGNDGSYEKPYATLAYALTIAAAKDCIIIKEDHAETVTGAGGLTASVAGLSVIGLGSYNQRPRFLMDAGTSVTFLVSGADVTIRNLVFAGGHSDIVTCFNITGKGCWIDKCDFVQNTTDENFLTPIKATGAANTADGLKVTNCYMKHIDTSTVEFIEITDDIDGLIVANNVVIVEGTACPLILQAGTKIMTGVFIAWNFLSNKNTAGALFMSNGGTGNTGIVAHNRFGHADVTTTHDWGAVTGLRLFDNLSTSLESASGFVLPAIDTNG